jgi:hypothetical protein
MTSTAPLAETGALFHAISIDFGGKDFADNNGTTSMGIPGDILKQCTKHPHDLANICAIEVGHNPTSTNTQFGIKLFHDRECTKPVAIAETATHISTLHPSATSFHALSSMCEKTPKHLQIIPEISVVPTENIGSVLKKQSTRWQSADLGAIEKGCSGHTVTDTDGTTTNSVLVNKMTQDGTVNPMETLFCTNENNPEFCDGKYMKGTCPTHTNPDGSVGRLIEPEDFVFCRDTLDQNLSTKSEFRTGLYCQATHLSGELPPPQERITFHTTLHRTPMQKTVTDGGNVQYSLDNPLTAKIVTQAELDRHVYGDVSTDGVVTAVSPGTVTKLVPINEVLTSRNLNGPRGEDPVA